MSPSAVSSCTPKNNLAAPPPGLAYRLVQTIVGEPGQGYLLPLGWEW